MKEIPRVLVRLTLVSVCAFATWRSVRLARADWLWGTGTLEGLDHAIQIEPSDGGLLALDAEYRSNLGDTSPELDRALERAAQLNPLDSSIPMTLGIRAEDRGDNAEAERYLVHATEMDHQFKPAWTLANFYFRTNRPAQMWTLIHHCLNLDPLGFDPQPVFDLCWNVSSDSKRILREVPRRRPILIQYLSYLMANGGTQSGLESRKVGAALEVWPQALAVMDVSKTSDTGPVTYFPEFLVKADRISEAMRAWNQLVQRQLIRSGILNPAAGNSIADPSFTYPLVSDAFGWSVASVPGIFISNASSPLRIEFDGNQPESLPLLSVLAPILPGRKYRLTWKSDSSRLSSPRDPGLVFRLSQQKDDTLAQCRPMLEAGDSGRCEFTNPADREKVRIDLVYDRAPGTTRIEGSLRLLRVALELAS